MPTYVYETIPQQPGASVRQFEFKQSMKDAPLSKHPETGEPVRRVISGGYGLIGANTGRTGEGQSASGAKSDAAPAKPAGGHSCGAGCGCAN